MKEAGRSKHSGTVVKKKSSSGCLTSDSSSRNLSKASKDKKRRRVVESDSESSDYSPGTTRQKVDKLSKGSAVHKGAYFENRAFETEKRVSNGLDVFEFDEYDGFDYSRIRKDANRGRHMRNSYGQSGDETESGNGATHNARSRSEMEDADFDMPLSELSNKYRSNQPMKLQGKNGVMKVTVNKKKQKEAKPKVVHKKKSHENGDHRVGGDEQTDDINSKEKGELKPMVEKEVNESDTVIELKSNSSVKGAKNVEKLKEKESRVKRGSGTERQILREKIKNMLLDAGWSIDYRPRKNKNYMDAIYTNPAGTAYWSIIKAYETLQREEEGNTEPLPVEIFGKLERQSLKKMEKEPTDELGSRNGKRYQEEELNSNSRARKSRRLARSTLLARDSNKAENDGSALYSGKRNILAWLIDSGVVNMSEHVEYMNGRRTRVLKKGRITRDGIHCGCCNKILTVSKFEQHSGSKLCNPFPNMFLECGKSLMQCQIDAWSKLGELEQKGFYRVDVDGDDPNDDTCSVCGDGGDLICCDGCPSTFHQSCLDIEMLPEHDWLCPNCSCKYCKMAAENCTKEGVKTEASLLACCLCHKKYHESCRPEPHEYNSLDLSFCGQECHQVYIGLQKLVGVKHEVEAGFSWSLIHRSDSLTDGSVSVSVSERVEWNCMLGVAMSVMEECFLPFTDTRTGINLIRNVVFNCGSNLSRLNYSGFYTAILERGDEVVCAASIRIHGTKVAEMPFIGTRHIYRRQGMCRRLLSAIESALSALQVEKLIIPAVAEHMNTWTDVFGFQPLKEPHKQQLKSMNVNMLVFPGTDMLQKPLLNQVGNNTVEVDDISALSRKPKLISSKVADKNATTDSGSQEFCVPLNDGCSIDVSKETRPVNSRVKDESLCDSTRKEYDSIRSHSDSEVGEIDVQNSNEANPLPDQVHDPSPDVIGSDIPCESHEQVPTDPSKLQQSEKESDVTHSHSNSKIGKIPVQNSNGINVVELSDKTAITDCGSQVVGVPLDDGSLDKKIHPINPSVIDKSQPELQLPGKESDSILTHADSKVEKVAMRNEDRVSQLPTHVHDPSHDTIQLSQKESFSSVDVQIKGNNTVEVAVSKTSELISSNVAELSDKNATTDSGSQESSKEALPLDSHVKDESPCDPALQPPGKESDSIHSHSDSRVDEIVVQNDGGTDPKGNNTVEVEEGIALSKKPELISSNVVEFRDKTTTTMSSDSQEVGVNGCCLDASKDKDTLSINSPVKDDISISAHSLESVPNLDRKTHFDLNVKESSPSSESILQLPEKESDSICCSQSGSKVDKIAVQTGNGHDENECFSCVVVQTDSMVLETDRKEKETGAVTDSEAINDLSGCKCNTMEVDDVSALSKRLTEFSDKNVTTDSGSQESGVPLDDGSSLHASMETLPVSPCELPLPLPGKESDSIHSHSDSKADKMELQNGHGTNPLPAQVHDAIPSDIPCQSHEPGPWHERKLQQQAKESDSIHSHSDSKVDEADVQNGHGSNPLQDQVHDASIPCEPNLQQPCVSIHSHSDSKVDETDV